MCGATKDWALLCRGRNMSPRAGIGGIYWSTQAFDEILHGLYALALIFTRIATCV